MQNHGKTKRLNNIRQQLQLQPLPPKVQVPVSVRLVEKYGKDITLCPVCNTGKLLLIHIEYGRPALLIRSKTLLVKEEKIPGPAPP